MTRAFVGLAARLALRLAPGAALAAFLVGSLAAGTGRAPPMHVQTPRLPAGDHVLVTFGTPPVKSHARGVFWLTLVPAGSAERFVGERVMIEEGAVEATIAAMEEGPHELRLVSVGSGTAAVIARALIDVGAPVVGRSEPPAWYW